MADMPMHGSHRDARRKSCPLSEARTRRAGFRVFGCRERGCRYGPVSLYPQFPVIADADQISFHTQDALLVLTTAAIISHGTPVY